MNIRNRAVGMLVVSAALVLGAVPARAGLPQRQGAAARVARPARTRVIDTLRRLDVNNLNMFVANNGALAYDLSSTYNWGLFFPNRANRGVIFAAGLWLGAVVNGVSGPDTLMAVNEYSQEYQPGRIIGGVPEDPSDPRLIVYKVRSWRGVASDTAHVDNPNANPDIAEDPVVHHSWSEYINGAKPFGAPTRIYRLPTGIPGDTVSVEGPDVLGDEMLWCVFNDANPANHNNEAGFTAPMGIEVVETVFGFDRLGALGNTIFVKYHIANRGTNTLNQMYVSQWCDPDLGQFTDDLVGCDTLPDLNGHPRSMGFCYNGTNHDDVYGDIPPALGVDFLKGPIRPPADTLGLTSFAKYINGTDPLAFRESYRYMSGINGDGTPIVDPFGTTTRFMVAGDPFGLPSKNWVDSNPADRRMFLSSGPITMAPGDSQDVIVAFMVGQCGDRLSSIKALDFIDEAAQGAFNLAFDVAKIPAPPPTPVVRATTDHGQVTLNWDDAALKATLEPGYTFEGFNVYQGATVTGPWKLVAVYDSIDAIRTVFDTKFDDTNCEPLLSAPVAHGADNGLRDYHVATQDFVRGTSLKDGTDYYFAVTSYAVNMSATVNKVLESPLKAVIARPQRLTSALGGTKVLAVPNPYYAHSDYEQNQFSRRIRFLNCPAQCTIRIYNLAGQLVRTLTKSDPSTSVVEWDVQTLNGLPVGSGVYVYHVEVPGGHNYIGRVVVFMEKERLNNF